MKIIEIFLAKRLTASSEVLEFTHANEIVLGITPKGQRKQNEFNIKKRNVNR
jgi:hypothetical protein